MAEPLRVITQAESWKAEVQNDVVDRLRDLLAMAEAGEIRGIAYSSVAPDGSVMTGWSKNDDQSALIGGLERVKHRMLRDESNPHDEA